MLSSVGVHVIRVTASEIDKLTPQIVSAAVAVRRNTEDLAAREHLEMLRKEWASKVQLLTATIDEITDKGDFMAEAGWEGHTHACTHTHTQRHTHTQ